MGDFTQNPGLDRSKYQFFMFPLGFFLLFSLIRNLSQGSRPGVILLILPWALTAVHYGANLAGNVQLRIWGHQFDYDQISEYACRGVVDLSPFEAFMAVILTNIWLGFPFMMVVALGALQSIPGELYEAADVDGASSWSQFWNITAPLLKPAMIPAITLRIVWTFNNINVVWLVSNGGENRMIKPISWSLSYMRRRSRCIGLVGQLLYR